jgi:hypothetical protein
VNNAELEQKGMAVLREFLARSYLADDRDISRAIFEWKTEEIYPSTL